MVAMNVFRILADLSHIASKCILIWAIHSNKSAEGGLWSKTYIVEQSTKKRARCLPHHSGSLSHRLLRPLPGPPLGTTQLLFLPVHHQDLLHCDLDIHPCVDDESLCAHARTGESLEIRGLCNGRISGGRADL